MGETPKTLWPFMSGLGGPLFEAVDGVGEKEMICEPAFPSSFFFVRPSQLRRIL